ncbi:hypothetical protein SASPL_120034 [Salvia splendens]|uniref:Uncharacterized protein n=1 Tax=Salvia splendens TaxID=180675 RepID=A0A8X8ZVU5_SALSN|nr:hypothetical protein SASPL_120034 [Salvia splendens]
MRSHLYLNTSPLPSSSTNHSQISPLTPHHSSNGDQGLRPPFLPRSEKGSCRSSRKRPRLRAHTHRFSHRPAEEGPLDLNQSIRSGARIPRWRFAALRITGHNEIYRACIRKQGNSTDLGGSEEDGGHRSLAGSGSSEIRHGRPETELRDSGEAHQGTACGRRCDRRGPGPVGSGSRHLRGPVGKIQVFGWRRVLVGRSAPHSDSCQLVENQG